jgi:hypothetical protein
MPFLSIRRGSDTWSALLTSSGIFRVGDDAQLLARESFEKSVIFFYSSGTFGRCALVWQQGQFRKVRMQVAVGYAAIVSPLKDPY